MAFIVLVSLLGALLDVGCALLVFPTGLSRASGVVHLVLDAFRLWLLLALCLAVIFRIAVALSRRFRPSIEATKMASTVIAVFASAMLTGFGAHFALALVEREKLEFPGIGILFQCLVLGGSSAVSIAFFLGFRKLLSSWLILSTKRAGAILFSVSLFSVFLGTTAVHVAVAPVYEHRVALLVASFFLAIALFLREISLIFPPTWIQLRTPPRFLMWGVMGVFASWPLAQNAHSRFVLFGHVPVAGAVGVTVRTMTDWDNDGAGPWYLGGADCAPTDGTIAPGLNEIPGDGIDQDCRGGDAPVGGKFFLPLLAPSCSPPQGKLANVILITVDALRADKIHPDIAPFLFKLRSYGQYYERAYAPSGSTSGSILGIFSGIALSDMNSGGLTSPDELRQLESIPMRFSANRQPVALLNFFALNPQINRTADLNGLPWGDPLTQEVKHSLQAASMVRTLLDFTLHAHERSSFAWAHIPDLHAPYTYKSRDPEISNYEHALQHVDAQLARLYSALVQSKKLDETLVIITSDHGEQLGERGREGHGTLFFEEGLRVPLFILAPGCSAHWEKEPVSLRSLFELVNAYGIDGRRVSSPRSKPSPPLVVVEEAMLTALGVKRAFIGTRFKLVEDFANGGKMVFDLNHDAGELENISGENLPELREFEAQTQLWLDSPGRR